MGTKQTPKTNLPYPNYRTPEWDSQFEDLMSAIDLALYSEWEDRNLALLGGGLLTWNAVTGVLSWGDPIYLPCAPTGMLWVIPAGSITVADGQYIYMVLSRAISAASTVTLGVGGSVPVSGSKANSVMFAVRKGTQLYFRGGHMLNTGDSLKLFEISSSSMTISMEDPKPTGKAAAAGTSTQISAADHVHRLEMNLIGGDVTAKRPQIVFTGYSSFVDNSDEDQLEIGLLGGEGKKIVQEELMLVDTDSDTSGWTSAGGRYLSASERQLTGATLSTVLFADGYVTTDGLQGEVRLVDLSASSAVLATVTLTSVTPARQTAVVTITDGHIYEVQYAISGGTSTSDKVFVMAAGVRFVNTIGVS